MIQQDPWEENLSSIQFRKTKLGQLFKSLALAYIGGGLGGGSGGMSGLAELGSLTSMQAPGAEGGAVVTPQGQGMQKTVDSFAGFFEKLNNPNVMNTFAEFARKLQQYGK